MKRARTSIFICLLLSLTTCDLLDITPNDTIDLEDFYAVPSEAESALIGSYIQTYFLFTDLLLFNNRSSDDLTAPLDGRQTDVLMFRPSLNIGSGEPTALWNSSYSALASINLLLERVPAINPNLFAVPTQPGVANRQQQILGEARFLRAYIYYHLTLFYGDVPLITEFPKSSDPQDNLVSRTPKEQVMAQVMNDLAFAETNIPWNHEGRAVLPEDQLIQSKGRATKAAAKLLIARIHLYNEEWQLAIDKCREIIASGEYRLETRWTRIFNSPESSGNQNTSESILEIQNRRGPDQFNNNGGYSWFHQDGSPRRGATQEAYDLFEGTATNPRDVRKVFSMSQRIEFPNQIYAIKYRNAAPWWDPPDPFNFIPMRLTECYLIIAEALNELGYPNSEALTNINLIRARARDLNFIDGP
ncbi:MAG: RagB/SusD family nutrient uptake outer membrane protein, partial [Cyclobacteriaceae bacterium]|nr:RagB/SusD family nutrient uptake outer membrane protein [Cyclobacteriaceae bacterium]